MKAAPDGPQAAFDASNGYVNYTARRERRLLRELRVDLRRLRQRRRGVVLRRGRQRRPAPTARRRPSPPARLRDDHHRPLPLPLRRPLADDQRPHLARRRRDLRPGPDRPLEGARVPAGPRLRDAVLRLRGGGHELGRLEHAARRARRPGARDPRDVGRRLGHERDPAARPSTATRCARSHGCACT